MKPGGGKAKGSAYERRVAEILTKAYYPDSDGKFQRIYSHPIPTKGARPGDLMAMRRYRIAEHDEQMVVDVSWPFSVECKNYKDVKPVFCGLYCANSAVWDWMEQAEETASQLPHLSGDDKMPLVVFRLFRTADVAMINGTTFGKLHALFGFYQKTYYTAWRQCLPTSHALHFFLLSEFLEWIDWGVYKVSSSQKYIRSIIRKGE